MFFVVSKLFWLLAQPISLCALMMLAGLLLTALRRPRSGLWMGAAGLSVLLVSAYTNLGAVMIAPLEGRFERPASMPPDISTIIMLGGATDGDVSAARGISELNDAGDRVVETVRLAELYPEAKIVLTGGSGSLGGQEQSEASIVARLIQAMGIAPERLMLEEASRNTDENAGLTRAMLGDRTGRILLVTSAFHMPRSIGLFNRVGLDVVPWPVDYRSTGVQRLGVDLANPVLNLSVVTTATREWIGLLVYAATGRIASIFPEQQAS